MSTVIKRPLSAEQIAAREQKKAARAAAERETEKDLIIAHLMEKVSKLEAEQK